MELESIINLSDYPLIQLDTLNARKDLTEFKTQFQENGVCVLPNFLTPLALKKAIEQAQQLEDLAYHNSVTGNAYLDEPPNELPSDHPRRLTDRTSLGVIAYDQIPTDNIIRQVYESDFLTRFIEHITGKENVYRYNCSLGALNISVMTDGEYLRWHFDQSDFVVSIPLQNAESGGEFEYVHNIRTPGHENYDAVGALLRGSKENVQILDAQPGSLILFQGLNTIHRVTEIHGKTSRLGALLGYVDQPDICSSDYLKKIRYGRA